MNDYSRIRNTHDRAVILAQLVNADAAALSHVRAINNGIVETTYAKNYEQSRAELWKLIGPAPEGEASEA